MQSPSVYEINSMAHLRVWRGLNQAIFMKTNALTHDYCDNSIQIWIGLYGEAMDLQSQLLPRTNPKGHQKTKRESSHRHNQIPVATVLLTGCSELWNRPKLTIQTSDSWSKCYRSNLWMCFGDPNELIFSLQKIYSFRSSLFSSHTGVNWKWRFVLDIICWYIFEMWFFSGEFTDFNKTKTHCSNPITWNVRVN